MIPDEGKKYLDDLADKMGDLRDSAMLSAVGQLAVEVFQMAISKQVIEVADVLKVCDGLDRAAANHARTGAKQSSRAVAALSLDIRNAYTGPSGKN